MLIHNVRLVTWGLTNEILDGGAVLVEKGRIAEIGPEARMLKRHARVERLDGRGQLLMPGNICAHTHFYGAFARGLAIPGRAPRDFPEILRKLWWPLDKALTPNDVRASAEVCLVDAIRHGTTTLIDHHTSPNAIDGSLDVIAEAVEHSGLRAVLCYEVTDRDGPVRARAGIQENVRFLKRCARGVAGGRVAGLFGLHASLTLSDQTLSDCRAAAPEGTGFHIHVAEHEADQYDSLARSGTRVVDRLAKNGILGPTTITAHGVHTDAREAELLAQTRTWVTHQPRSNMNNGVGAAPIESLVRAGVRVALGNDGFSNAMWEEWKTAYLLHKAWHRDPRRMPGDLVAEIGAYNNAALASQSFPGAPLGVLAQGAHADLILVDYHPTTLLSAGNLPWHILFGFHESMVTTTIVAGQILMQDRRLLTLDEAEVTARARALVPGVWQRYAGFVPADNQ
ncbi:MAG TPA: putative aminohydrolase SsnA [Anaerolineales bacterium]|nr:putative aminohydrolase SsnA [Anaerolineales bacterium]